ncbi:hypothetical protein [Streptomyces sp. NPDC017230]|uniref:hypothetical protein n=1 Tax=unclassified Streptomyces TaxID=2593676 RepID=UPI0037B7147C
MQHGLTSPPHGLASPPHGLASRQQARPLPTGGVLDPPRDDADTDDADTDDAATDRSGVTQEAGAFGEAFGEATE